MKILVADDEPAFSKLLAGTIRARTHHEVVTVEDGGRALEATFASPRPQVLILDWLMPKLTGTQVCRLVRGSRLEPQPYVLFVTARCRREELLECLASGADDLLTKPFAPDVLISRLELAQRHFERAAPGVAIERALRNAQKEGEGELVVRSGKLSARILFCAGKVAWIQLADSFGSLLDEISPRAGLDAESAQAIVAECRRTGRGLGETLKAWGLVNGDQLRDITRTWLEKKLSNLRVLERPECLFLPGRQRCSAELLFDLDELLGEEPCTTGPPSPEMAELLESEKTTHRPSIIPRAGFAAAFMMTEKQEPAISAVLGQALRAEGVIGVVALDRVTGICLGRLGEELDPDIVWAQLRMLNTISKSETVQDAHVGTKTHHHLMILLPRHPNVVFHAMVDGSRASLAAARLSLRSAVQGAPTGEVAS